MQRKFRRCEVIAGLIPDQQISGALERQRFNVLARDFPRDREHRDSHTEQLYDRFRVEEKAKGWIVSDSDHVGGKPRIRDTRITLALLLEWLAAGMTIAEIVKEYPSLREESIRGTLKELAHPNCWHQVKILLDENMPESLAGVLKDLGHEVDSVNNNLKLRVLITGHCTVKLPLTTNFASRGMLDLHTTFARHEIRHTLKLCV